MAGPLEGITVVDLSLLLPGPLCSQHLADLGADVIKVENPRMPDMTRLWSLGGEAGETSEPGQVSEPESGSTHGAKDGPMFQLLNRNKKGITLNIMRPEGRAILLRLLEKADVLLEGFRPGKMEELGVGYSQLKERFPALVYCAISGYGATGPLRDHAGHDGNYIARAGVLDLTGTAEKPVVPGIQIADVAGGTLIALSGILAALYARARTGKGQFVDVSMMDGAFSLLPLLAAEWAAGGSPKRGAMPLSGALPNYSVYQTKDGRHVMLGALEERFYRAFLRQTGHEDWMELWSARKMSELFVKMEELFCSKTLAEWSPLFENTECCLAPVNRLEEAFSDPQLIARGMAISGPGGPRIGSPFALSGTPAEPGKRAAPRHGEHTREILSALGFSDLDIEELQKKRTI